jgi:outer membrane protein
MKNISTLLSALALIGVAILFYLHFSKGEGQKRAVASVSNSKDSTDFRIAYFDIDSLQQNLKSFKEAEEQIKNKENNIKNQLTELNNRNQRRLQELQAKAPTMTQEQGEAAQRELAQLTQQFQQRELQLDQELKRLQMDLMTEVQKNVESYLKKYNQQKGFSFIVAYRPGEFIYYRDSTLDITNDLVNGLNKEYAPKKKD